MTLGSMLLLRKATATAPADDAGGAPPWSLLQLCFVKWLQMKVFFTPDLGPNKIRIVRVRTVANIRTYTDWYVVLQYY